MRPASLFKVAAGSVVFAIVGSAGAQSEDPAGQWEKRRAELLKAHYGVAEVLQVDQARVDKLAELLADQQVNRDKPQYFTEKVSSGQPAAFEIGDGLVLEALPILFEHDQYDLLLSYHEVGTTGKRWLAGTRSSGTLVKAPPGHQSRDLGVGGGGTIFQGDKAYAVQLSSIIEAI